MENQFDVIIIGAGPGGIFCAYELLDKKKDLKVMIVEKGRSIENASVPNGPRSSVWGVGPARSPQALQGQGLFRTENFPFPRMWAETCLQF